MTHARLRRAARLIVVGGTGLGLLSGCSSASSNVATKSATPAQDTTSNYATATATISAGSSAAPAALGECNKASILAALPAGSTMAKYECAIASPWMWAAARVKPGPTVFFLQATSGAWKVSTAEQLCGTPPKGLPKEISAFCPKV